ncbi:ATP6V1G3 isoform 1 [Pan troglodytes]|uniref:ATP6V1G3 isoform 1 n=1 Tax=Pan troglodytes TaxID=9598 RepID=A0A2J8KHY6_PANTR|nr:V-type proton ATPase subunit G 3 isoform X2 [Pan troglodytes]XP_054966044.1 V-type proton ATPase subunit G 3 isoform X3 [Pan paniscus]PNI34634.1 ATP6V1G3 isoform 1 [Pan troglodytes]
MTSQSQGIHQLLQAEKRAKDKLEEAKKILGLLFLKRRDWDCFWKRKAIEASQGGSNGRN